MQDPEKATFADRSARLILFGLVAILAGGGLLLLGVLYILLPLVADRLPGMETLHVDARSSVMGALIYALLGVAFAWVGLGSMRRRRWSRPLMLTLSWTWLLGGVATLVLLPGLVDVALGPAASGPFKLVMMFGVGMLGVVLPALFVWIYNDRNMLLTCEAHDPQPDWTERCPPSVLGLGVGLGGCGVLLVLMALRPAFPSFGWLLTGWPGAFGLIVSGAVCLWLAREVYALRMIGWWASTVFLVLVGVSTWLTLVRVEPAEWFRAMGYPEDSLPAADFAIGPVSVWMTVAFTLATVGYMAGIRKHFTRRS